MESFSFFSLSVFIYVLRIHSDIAPTTTHPLCTPPLLSTYKVLLQLSYMMHSFMRPFINYPCQMVSLPHIPKVKCTKRHRRRRTHSQFVYNKAYKVPRCTPHIFAFNVTNKANLSYLYFVFWFAQLSVAHSELFSTKYSYQKGTFPFR